MKPKSKKHREAFDVLFYHLDRNGRASICAMMNFMQATANMHGRTLGTSLEDFSEKNVTWVFSRFHIRMKQYPEHYDRITIDTWRSESKKCFAFREFEVYDGDENLIGAATASAVLIDKTTRKPLEIPLFLREQFSPESGRAIDDEFKPLATFDSASHKKSFHVRQSDIDLNQHVNNSSYVDWIVESVPDEILLQYLIVSCEVGYKAEAFYGETIQSLSYPLPADRADSSDSVVFLHRLVRCGDDRTITIARTKWKKTGF